MFHLRSSLLWVGLTVLSFLILSGCIHASIGHHM